MNLHILSNFIFILPAFVGSFYFKHYPRELKACYLAATSSGIVDTVTYFQFLEGDNNSYLLNLYIPLYFIIWYLPVYYAIQSKTIRNTTLVTLFISLGWLVFNLTFLDLKNTFYSNGIAMIGASLIIVNLIYLFYVSLLSDKMQLRGHPLFFISSAFIVYQAFNTSIFVFMNILDGEALMFLWNFRYASNIALNIIVSIVFVFYARTRE